MTVIIIYYLFWIGLMLFIQTRYPSIAHHLPLGGISDLMADDLESLEPVYTSVGRSLLDSAGPVRLAIASFSAAVLIVPVSWVYFMTSRAGKMDQAIDTLARARPPQPRAHPAPRLAQVELAGGERLRAQVEGAAGAVDPQRALVFAHLQRHRSQDVLVAEGLDQAGESDERVLAHRIRNSLVRKKSDTMTEIDETTTVFVVALPTPSAPPLAVRPL